MANKAVGLVRLCKTDSGWRRLPVVMGRNGKLRPGFALVKGSPVFYPEGHYLLRTYQGTKTVYQNVGNNPTDALNAQHRATHLQLVKGSARAAGIKIVEDPVHSSSGLLKKRNEFIERHKDKGQTRASQTSQIAIDDFLEATLHTHADQINEASVLLFYRYLRKRGNQDRTIYNKHVSLFGWFKWLGLDVKKLADKPPAFTEKEVKTFDPEDLTTLFAACTRYQFVVFETLLKTGLRMQEAMHLEWTNVDFRRKTIRVRERFDSDGHNVTIKDRAERTIPLSDDLATTLKAWKEERKGTRLVLGTANDTPNWKWLQTLKRVVRRAGLNCEHCKGCKNTKECSQWILHQFRATYTTTLLRNGVDPRTVMSYTGHSDFATMMRYLKPAEDTRSQAKINSIQWTA
jgi:integrase